MSPRRPSDHDCPCGSLVPYRQCCQPLHEGRDHAVTAGQLMRSRYSAFAVGDLDYLFRSWHPRHRPAQIELDSATVWESLEVTAEIAGGPDDHDGEVEFVAHYRHDGVAAQLHERSKFVRRAGRWVYCHAVSDTSFGYLQTP